MKNYFSIKDKRRFKKNFIISLGICTLTESLVILSFFIETIESLLKKKLFNINYKLKANTKEGRFPVGLEEGFSQYCKIFIKEM